MYTFLVLLTVLVAILLMVVVLLQAGKGEGLAGGAFGGGSSGSFGTMFGARRTADFLSIATWWLAGIMVALTLLINIFFLPQGQVEDRRSVIDSNRQEQTVPSNQIPQAPQQ